MQELIDLRKQDLLVGADELNQSENREEAGWTDICGINSPAGSLVILGFKLLFGAQREAANNSKIIRILNYFLYVVVFLIFLRRILLLSLISVAEPCLG